MTIRIIDLIHTSEEISKLRAALEVLSNDRVYVDSRPTRKGLESAIRQRELHRIEMNTELMNTELRARKGKA